MTILTRNPNNINPLQPNKFQLNFSRLPNMQFFAQTISVPGISLSEALQPTPFVDLYVPGEKAIYDLLNVTFIIDEKLEGWKEVHDWIRAMTFPKEFAEYNRLSYLNKMATAKLVDKPQYSDCVLTMLSSSNNPIIAFKYYDVFPTTISSFVVSSTDTPDSIITADATFRYSYFDIENLT
jgi:hypothetical protein